MRPRSKLYLEHFSAVSILISLTILISCIEATLGEMHTLLFAISLVYFVIFWFGYFIGVGPHKMLKKDLLTNYKDDLK